MKTFTKTTTTTVTAYDIIKATLDTVREHGPEHFNMGDWYTANGCSQSLMQSASIDIGSCGTTACMAGHMKLQADKLLGRDQAADMNQFDLADMMEVSVDTFCYDPARWPDNMRQAHASAVDEGATKQFADFVAAQTFLCDWLIENSTPDTGEES